ncbi:MAG: putative lipid II flippase FtsW [Pseudomonadota bacterium]
MLGTIGNYVGQALPPSTDLRSGLDPVLLGAASALLLFGLVMVSSASIGTAERLHGDALYFLWRQTLYILIATGVGVLAASRSLDWWQKMGPLLLLFGAALLVLVLVESIGREINGARRWIRIGGFSLQPSELIKLVTIVYLAGYLVRRSEEVKSVMRGFLKPVLLLSIIAALLLAEPDYGTVVVLFIAAFGMLFLGGVPLTSYVVWIGIVGLALGLVAWTEPYRIERLIIYLNPWAEPFGSGFQLTQALIAIGRGEWFGVGLGASVQKLFYLPEAHTDFLFAVIGEELGFAGMAIVIALFGAVIWRAFRIAANAARMGHAFGAHLAYGLGLLIGLQAFINIGVNLGVLPTKGLALPFMSFGGNNLLVNCIAIGLLIRVHAETRVAR